MSLARHDFPQIPLPDFTVEMAQRIIGSPGGLGLDLYLEEKVMMVGCLQKGITQHRQYETFCTGFTYALGPAEGIVCPGVAFVSQMGGYCMNMLGFGQALTETALLPVVAILLLQGSIDAVCTPEGEPKITLADEKGTGATPCRKVEFAGNLLGETTPLFISSGTSTVELSSSPHPHRFQVGSNMFTSAVGYLLAEPLGMAGSTLTLSFNPAVREIRKLPLAVNDATGPATLEIGIFQGDTLIDSVTATARVANGAPFAEATINLLPGQPFNRVSLMSGDPTKEFAVSGFEVCLEPVNRGDLDRDGDIDEQDF